MTARLASAAAFVACVYGANWALGRYGVVDFAGLGLMVPAGVYFAGAAFGLRDVLHELGGRRWVLAAIAIGTLLSWLLEDGTIPGGHVPIAAASAAAFGLSELADLAVYEPLRRRSDKVLIEHQWHGYGYLVERRTPFTDHKWWITAVVASQIAGSLVDSILFLWLAFGTTTGWWDLTVAKFLMVVVTLPVVWGVRRAVPRHSLGTESA